MENQERASCRQKCSEVIHKNMSTPFTDGKTYVKLNMMIKMIFIHTYMIKYIFKFILI